MSIKDFRLDRKSAGAQALDGLWGPGPPGDLLYDMSGRGNHATRIGSTPDFRNTERGLVPWYDGVDDAYNCERRINLDAVAFTVMAWVWSDSTVATTVPAVCGMGESNPGDWRIRLANAQNPGVSMTADGDAGGIACNAAAGSFDAVRDTWVHVAFTRWIGAAAGAALYQDGLLMATDAVAPDDLNVADVLQIGCCDNKANRWWKGYIDDVRWYSRALSIAQVTHIYRTTRYHPYADIALGRIRRHGRVHTGHVRRAT